MPGRRQRTALRRRSAKRAGVTLAVYHASSAFEQHLAALRRARRFRLVSFPQSQAPMHVASAGFDGVLWELVPGARPDRRRLSAIARATPIVSYSAEAGREIAELSRALGFASHLRTPLAPIDVVQTEAEVATRREQLLLSTYTVAQTEDQIKKIVSKEADPGLVLARLQPAETPSRILNRTIPAASSGSTPRTSSAGSRSPTTGPIARSRISTTCSRAARRPR